MTKQYARGISVTDRHIVAPAKIPLMELMAEISWTLPGEAAGPASCLSPQLGAPLVDREAVMPQDIAASLAVADFGRLSTLWPAAPAMTAPSSSAWRLCTARPGDARFYQLEPSRFQAVASPPHHRWLEVESFIGNGVEALLAGTFLSGIARASLVPRLVYQDAFDDETDGVQGFIARTCGIQLTSPSWLRNYAATTAGAYPSWRCAVPLAGDARLDIEITADVSEPGRVLVRSGVIATRPVKPSPGALASFFDSAHDVVHRLYLDMHEPSA